MLGRECPEPPLPCDAVFAEEEWKAVTIMAKRQPTPEEPPSHDEMVRMVAGFGGFLNPQGRWFPRATDHLDRTPAQPRFRDCDSRSQGYAGPDLRVTI